MQDMLIFEQVEDCRDHRFELVWMRVAVLRRQQNRRHDCNSFEIDQLHEGAWAERVEEAEAARGKEKTDWLRFRSDQVVDRR